MQTNISSNIEAALIKWGAGQPHPTGDFLRAVLTNDLFEAVARADMHNRATLAEIVNYVRWNLPPECYGSSQKYDAWISKARVESMIERSEERDDPAELEARSGTWTIDASEFARQMEHEAELEAAQLAALVRAVNMHARAHYNEGGWDVIVECWDDAEIAQLLVEDAVTTEAEAIAAFVPLVEVWREQETDV